MEPSQAEGRYHKVRDVAGLAVGCGGIKLNSEQRGACLLDIGRFVDHGFY